MAAPSERPSPAALQALLDRCLSTPTLRKVAPINDITDKFVYHPTLAESQLGKGSFGEVYRMRRKSDNRLFAVKMSEKSKIASGADCIQHMMVEIIVTTTLGTAKGFAHTENVYHSPQFIFLVMDLVEGKYTTFPEPSGVGVSVAPEELSSLHGVGLRNRLYHFFLKHDQTQLGAVEEIARKWEAAAIYDVYVSTFGHMPEGQGDLSETERHTANYNTILGNADAKKCFETRMKSIVAARFQEYSLQRKLEPSHAGDMFTFIESHRAVPLEKLKIVFRSLCDTLQFLHTKAVVHRDLKPENVMVVEDRSMKETTTAEGRKMVVLRDRLHVKLIDFGLAKIMNAPSVGGFPASPSPFLQGVMNAVDAFPEVPPVDKGKAIAVTPCGTELYSASESLEGILAGNLRGQKWISNSDSLPKLDMWAAGVILYCLHYGRLPFRVDPRTVPRTLDRHGQRKWRVQKLKELVSSGLNFPTTRDVPEEVKLLMRKLTTLDIAERPNAAAVLQDEFLQTDISSTDVVMYELVFDEAGDKVETVNVVLERASPVAQLTRATSYTPQSSDACDDSTHTDNTAENESAAVTTTTTDNNADDEAEALMLDMREMEDDGGEKMNLSKSQEAAANVEDNEKGGPVVD
eukprot:PhM_4_TR3636/c0_g1_i1/m.27728